MFSGSLVAIVTPLRADGSIDDIAWGKLLDFHLENGTSGVVVGGSTGESGSLSDAELRQLTELACARISGRMRVVASAATNCTATTVERVRKLASLAVDGIMVVTPSYVKPTQEGLYRHFAAVAEAASAPLILYNVPSRTAVDMIPETVERLAKVQGIKAIKEAVPDIPRVRELIQRCGTQFDVLSGDDPTACEAVLNGASGVISVTANIAPRAMSEMINAAAQGDAAKARRLDQALTALHNGLFVETNPIAVKWSLVQMGLIGGTLRLPLTELTDKHHRPMRDVLSKAGVLND